MDLDEDVLMHGTMTIESQIIKSQETDGDVDTRFPQSQIQVKLTSGPNEEISRDSSDSPGPARFGGLSLPKSYQDTASDEDDASSLSSFPSGNQRAGKFVGVVITKPVAQTLPHASAQTGLVYDPRMRFHTELELDEEEDIHPEDPRRIYEIYKDLVEAGLVLTEGAEVDERIIPFTLYRINARLAEPAEICLVHSQKHYEWMMSLRDKPNVELVDLGKQLDSLYLHQLSLYCARLSAGGAIEACRAVAAGVVKNAIAVIRPPGHHAEQDKPGGFCFFDNVAIAAKVCQKDFGNECRRILILDWDVHHGNGVQQAFEDDPNVLYISLHVHKNGTFYPSGDYGDHLHVGTGAGEGRNINIPWPRHNMTDGDYLYAFQHVVMPVAQEFDPQLVIISAGFDAAEGDMLGACHVSPAGFAHMTHMLKSLASGKVVACLEGGYNLRAIAKSALAVTKTLMNEPPERLPEGTEAQTVAVDTVNLVIRTHSPYWKCLYPKNKAKSRLADMGGERLHDLLRRVQFYDYFEKYKMSTLWIMRDKISKSFENQVLATENYTDPRPLLIIFHDPPETIGEQNAHTGVFDAHNIIVTDVGKQYLEWAVSQNFAVIDVNMPKFVTGEDDERGYTDSDPLETRLAAMRDCASYLWENHVEPYESTEIFLMGIGAASSSVAWLLGNQETCQDRVRHVFNFIAESSLVPVQKAADDYFPDWYHRHSTVYVAQDHSCWNPERSRRLRKKYGSLRRSEYNDLNEMLKENWEEVQDKLLEMTKGWRNEQERLIQPPPPTSNSRVTAPGPGFSKYEPAFPGPRYLSETQSYAPPHREMLGAMHGPPHPHQGQAQAEIPVRGSPGGSPNPSGLRSPAKLPPVGMFWTSPERGGAAKKSPERFGASGSPMLGSPGRRA